MKRLFALSRARTIAVVDVQSGHIGCAIISVADKKAQVLAHARSKLSLEVRDTDHARARLAEEIAEATKLAHDAHLAKNGANAVSEVYAILHRPWASSRVVAAKASSQNDMVIRAAHLEKLLASAVQGAGIDAGGLFEAAPLSTHLNGYPTVEPEGKRAHTVELYAIASTIDAVARTTIEESLHKSFPAAEVRWASATRVFSTVLPLMKVPEDCVVVHFGVQAMQLSLLDNHILSGERAAVDGLASVVNKVHGTRPPEEMISLFRMLARDACADEACTELQQALAVTEPELVKAYAQDFAAFAEVKRLPQHLILLTHPDLAPWLEHFFERIDFTQFTITALPFSVHTPHTEDMSAILTGDLTLDPTLALVSAYAARL